MKKNVVKTAHAKGLSLLLAAGMLVSQMSGVSADAKAKKPKLSSTKVSVTVGKTKKVTVKNAKKVTWKVTKKAAKIVKLTKKSKKGATIKGLKKGTAKISVQMKNGKRSRRQTITVQVKKKRKLTKNRVSDVGARTAQPTATVTEKTVPTATPVFSHTPEVSTGKKLDLTKFKNSSNSGTIEYDEAEKLLKVKDVKYFHIPMPETITQGIQVNFVIRGKYNGSKGFRVWLAGAEDISCSEQLSSKTANINGDFEWKFTLTSTESCGFLEIKGISYQDAIDQLAISEIQVDYNLKESVITPTPVALPSDLPADKVPARATTAPGEHAVASLPLMYTDVPDVDYIRVGDDYYMVSTTMFLSPGVPIMHSKDLVHWKTVSYVYDVLEDNDTTNLKNGKECYAKGSWAASIRYNEADQLYYVCFSSNDQNKTYIYTTDDIENGTWKKHSAEGTKHDPSLLFENGKMYIFSGNGNITVQEAELKDDKIVYSGTARTIIKKASSKNIVSIEGSHAYKIGEYYYLFFIEWPKSGKRMEWCYRAKKLTDEWEGKVVFCDDTGLNGSGIAQGGIVDTKYGDYYAILFRDHGAVGRTPVLLDVYWVDGWPMMGSDNGKAKASTALDVNLTKDGENYIYADDDFSYSENKLQLVWQWNHNPDNENWSVTERDGYLRLRTGSLSTSIRDARNSLTQRTFGPKCTSEVCMDVTNMKNGDYAGICAFQNVYGQVGVKKGNDGKAWIYYGSDDGKTGFLEDDESKVSLKTNKVYLKIEYDFTKNSAVCYYSVDGVNWSSIGKKVTMNYDLKIFMGYRTYLYNFATTQTGGYVDFDYYKIY